MTKRHQPRSVGYGQACLTCAKAKARCVPRADGSGCERCQRLIKECRPSEPVGRRRQVLAESTPEAQGRIAMLEGRLGELLSELQSRSVIESQNSSPQQDTGVNGADHRQTRFTSVTPTSPSANLATSLEATLDTALDTHVNDISRSEVNGGAHFDTHMIESSSAVIQDRPQFDSAGTNLASAPVPVLPETEQLNLHSTTCLERFRSFMLPYFPFLQLAPDLTFAQLRQDRPLLLQAIFCVAWPVAQEKPALARMLKLAFSEAAFLDYAKNSRSSVDATVDLLLALMTYIAWGWDHVYNRGSLSRLTMLCLSLVGELLLDRPKPQEPHTGHLLTPMSQRRYTESSASVFEHRRAALGCFVLSSIVSGYFSDMDAMKWTPQLEEILTTLDTNERSTADKDLVLQVRLELLRAKAGHLRSLLQKHPNQAQEPQKPAAEVFSDAETLLADLQKLRRTSYTCSQHLQQTHLAHTYYVELIILETIRVSSALASLENVSTSVSSNTNNDRTDGPPPQGYSDLSYLWQTVLAISACTSGLLSLPSDFSGISFLQWEQLAGCIVILSQLESIEDPRINRAHARSVVDLPVVLDRIVEKLSQMTGDAGEQGHVDGVFTQLAEGMRAFRASIQTGAGQPVNQPGAGGDVSACGGSTTFIPAQGYFMNNRFWLDQLFVGSSGG